MDIKSILVAAIVFCFAQLSNAKMSESFQYQLTDDFDTPPIFEVIKVSNILKKMNYLQLDYRNSGKIPFIGVDQVYTNSDSVIFLKMGLKPNNQLVLNKKIMHPKGILYHSQTASKKYYTLFFYKTASSEVDRIIKKIAESYAYSRLKIFNNIYISSQHKAFALVAGQCQTQQIVDYLRVSRTKDKIVSDSFTQILKTCAVSALKGITDGVQDLAQQTWYVIKNLFTDPEKLWDSVVSSYESIVDTITNIKPKLESLFATMSGLDPEVIAEIACSTVASIIPQILLPGMGAVKIAKIINDKLNALEKLKPILAKMSNLRKSEASTNSSLDLTSGLVQCAF